MSGVHLRRRVTNDGETRWMVVYRVGGRYGRIRSAGTFPTQKLARARAEQVDYAIAVGLDPQAWLRDDEPEPILIPSATFPATGDVILAVLALVEEQRKENEQLREALGKYAKHDALCARVYDYHNDCTCGLDALRDALAGSPAENKEEA